MTKAKTSKGSDGGQNTLQHARINYLHRIAVHLSDATTSAPTLNDEQNEALQAVNTQPSTAGIQFLDTSSSISKERGPKEHDLPPSDALTHTFYPFHRLPR